MADTGVRLEVASTQNGYVARIVGRGTMKESPCFQKFVAELLDRRVDASCVVDLDECTYLDSTFLGCLLALHRQYVASPPRFYVAASDDTCRALFGPTRLDLIVARLCAPPEHCGDWLDVPHAQLDRRQFTSHLIDCHHKLAEIDGPQAEAFRKVAEQLERELAAC